MTTVSITLPWPEVGVDSAFQLAMVKPQCRLQLPKRSHCNRYRPPKSLRKTSDSHRCINRHIKARHHWCHHLSRCRKREAQMYLKPCSSKTAEKDWTSNVLLK